MRGAMTLAELLAEAQAAIGRSEARLLLRHRLQRDEAWLIAHGEEHCADGDVQALRAQVARRVAGEPVAYITGTREFYGREFMASPAVLIPRPETEMLVELALQRLPQGACVLDLGTGSGCIGVTLAAERPDLRLTLVDASAEALDVARANARRWAPANTTLLASDWFSALAGRHFDMIVSNPPYIAAGDSHLAQGDLRFEPRAALVAGDDGLAGIRRIVAGAPAHLAPGGWLMFEHGYDQHAACTALLQQAGYRGVFSARDLAGILRVSGGQTAENGDG
jgi:release factor glutamine methyltransferase